MNKILDGNEYLSIWILTLISVFLSRRMDPVGPGSNDPIHHLQLPGSLPLLLPALHFAEGRSLLPHWNLPDPCQ